MELIQYDKSSWHLCSPATRARRGGVRVRVSAEAEAAAAAAVGAEAVAVAAVTAVLQERRPLRSLRLPSRQKANQIAASRNLLAR